MVNVTEVVLRPLQVNFGTPRSIKSKDAETQKNNMHVFSQPWQQSLGGYSEDVLRDAVQRAIEDCEFFPKLKEFRKFVQDAKYIKSPISHNRPKQQENTWRQKNEHLFSDWYKENVPVFTGTPFTFKLLNLATMCIYKCETPQEVERFYNNARRALTSCKHNNPATDDDLERLRVFANGYSQKLDGVRA